MTPRPDHEPQPDGLIRQCPGCLLKATRRHLAAAVHELAVSGAGTPEARRRLAIAEDGLDAFLYGFFLDAPDDHPLEEPPADAH